MSRKLFLMEFIVQFERIKKEAKSLIKGELLENMNKQIKEAEEELYQLQHLERTIK